jgi:hypothetical protein
MEQSAVKIYTKGNIFHEKLADLNKMLLIGDNHDLVGATSLAAGDRLLCNALEHKFMMGSACTWGDTGQRIVPAPQKRITAVADILITQRHIIKYSLKEINNEFSIHI